jgi:hypothetical protein
MVEDLGPQCPMAITPKIPIVAKRATRIIYSVEAYFSLLNLML